MQNWPYLKWKSSALFNAAILRSSCPVSPARAGDMRSHFSALAQSISFPESTFPLCSGTRNERLWNKSFRIAFSLAEYLSIRNQFRLWRGWERTTKWRKRLLWRLWLLKITEQPYICRCFNSGFANHPIDLFGAKAESENLHTYIHTYIFINPLSEGHYTGC